MKRAACACAAAAALGASLAFAQAGPPLLTDDPGTPGDGHWEVNFAWTSERTPGAHVDERPLVDVNYSIGERVQLKLEMPWLATGGNTRGGDGFGEALAGVKWRFYDAGERGWQLSTYPQVGFLMPGLHHSRLDDRGTSWLLPLEIRRDFGAVEAGAEVGRTFRSGAAGGGWIAGVAVGHAFGEAFELLAELHDESIDGVGHELAANIGARRMLSAHFVLLASVGRDLENGIERRNTLLAYLGLQLLR